MLARHRLHRLDERRFGVLGRGESEAIRWIIQFLPSVWNRERSVHWRVLAVEPDSTSRSAHFHTCSFICPRSLTGLRDLALERCVVQKVILGVHGKTVALRVLRKALASAHHTGMPRRSNRKSQCSRRAGCS